jgi:hypothetical protein
VPVRPHAVSGSAPFREPLSLERALASERAVGRMDNTLLCTTLPGMFIRWHKRQGKTDVHWGAVLVEAVRVDGKPRQRHVAYLGGFSERRIDSVDQRRRFWGQVKTRLHALAGRISDEDRNRIIGEIAGIVPVPTPTRGGAGRGQGRKPVLTSMQMVLLGLTCEALWCRLRERKARAQYRNQPHVKDIRQEQARTNLIPVRLRGHYSSRDTRRDVSENINDTLDNHRRAAGHAPSKSRFVSIPHRRPYGKREWVKRVVIRWYHRTHGIVVSPRRIQDCWEKYRKDF